MRVIAARESAAGAHHPSVAAALTYRGDALAREGNWKAAEAALGRSLAIWDKQAGTPPERADALLVLGKVRLGQKRPAEAVALIERARVLDQKVRGEDSPYHDDILAALGEAYLAAGRADDAVRALESAAALAEKLGGRTPSPAVIRFHLARALWTSGKRARALEVARAARDAMSDRDGRAACRRRPAGCASTTGPHVRCVTSWSENPARGGISPGIRPGAVAPARWASTASVVAVHELDRRARGQHAGRRNLVDRRAVAGVLQMGAADHQGRAGLELHHGGAAVGRRRRRHVHGDEVAARQPLVAAEQPHVGAPRQHRLDEGALVAAHLEAAQQAVALGPAPAALAGDGAREVEGVAQPGRQQQGHRLLHGQGCNPIWRRLMKCQSVIRSTGRLRPRRAAGTALGTGGDMAGQWTRTIPASEIPDGGARTVKKAGKQIAVFRAGGEVHAIDNRCPHEGYPLAARRVQDGILTCEWHNWKFRLCDGVCVHGRRGRAQLSGAGRGRRRVDWTSPIRRRRAGPRASRRSSTRWTSASGPGGADASSGCSAAASRRSSILARGCELAALRAPDGIDHGLATAADAAALLTSIPAEAGVILLEALNLLLDEHVRRPPRTWPRRRALGPTSIRARRGGAPPP